MADEEFEIDIYGDAGGDQTDGKADSSNHAAFESNNNIDLSGGNGDYTENNDNVVAPSEKPPQGVKRKSEADDRPVDPGATTALLVSDLNWWNTDDDIRGWCREAHCEDELKDITFSEHKVNAKSKGQAYVEFYSQAAASAAKHRIDSLAENSSQPGQKRHAVIYTSPSSNPFRTLPKDAPARKQEGSSRAPSGPGYSNDVSTRGNFSGGFNRGNGFRGRGMGNQGYNNRAFPGGNMGGGFGGGNMGFNSNMGGGGFGFGGRGNMMGGGMRGGPGGMRGRGGGGGGGGMNMMGGMGPMGGMGMGGMPGGMGGMGGMGMGMGFQGMNPGPFGNPGFFAGGNQSGGGEWQNPHGAKRQRPE